MFDLFMTWHFDQQNSFHSDSTQLHLYSLTSADTHTLQSILNKWYRKRDAERDSEKTGGEREMCDPLNVPNEYKRDEEQTKNTLKT